MVYPQKQAFPMAPFPAQPVVSAGQPLAAGNGNSLAKQAEMVEQKNQENKEKKPHPATVIYKHLRHEFALTHYKNEAYAIKLGRSDQAMTPLVREGHRKLYGWPGKVIPVRSGELRRLIVKVGPRLMDLETVAREIINQAVDRLEAGAFDGPETPLAMRFHCEAGKILVDLAEPGSGRCIEITAPTTESPTGWRVLDHPAFTSEFDHTTSEARISSGVFFRRGKAMRPLPAPKDQDGNEIRGARLDELAAVFGIDPAGQQFKLMLGWVLGLAHSGDDRPGLLMYGPPGRGKTTMLRLAASVVEPTGVNDLGTSFGRNSSDDMVRAYHRPVPIWDNVTSISQETSDHLCSMITGGEHGKRRLFTDAEYNSISVRLPLGLSSLGIPPGLQPDALSRLVLVDTPELPAHRRGHELQRDFDAAHPRLLAAWCDATAAALAGGAALEQAGQLPRAHRMATYAGALFAIDNAVAAGRITGVPGGWVEVKDEQGGVVSRWWNGLYAAYAANQADNTRRAAVEDVFGSALLDLLASRWKPPQTQLQRYTNGTLFWPATAGQILDGAGIAAGIGVGAHVAGWPSGARKVPVLLNALTEPLRACGVFWTKRTLHGKTRYEFTVSDEFLSDQGAL